ncbi:MAG: hypothetical protein L3J04_00405 [Robiginitomaculum sp.]|nr:hypothetical protein [Robiginitomaculum sp.]
MNQAVQASFGMIAYDGRGNMTSAGSRNYGYNIYNQLTSVNDGTNSASMSYDAYGRLSQSNGNLDNTKFAYFGRGKEYMHIKYLQPLIILSYQRLKSPELVCFSSRIPL